VFAPVFAISRNIKTGNSCSSFLLSDSPPDIDECKERGCFPFSCSVLSFEKHEGGGGDKHKGGAGDTQRSRGCFPFFFSVVFFEIHIISYLSRGAASLLRWCSFSLCSLCSLSFTPDDCGARWRTLTEGREAVVTVGVTLTEGRPVDDVTVGVTLPVVLWAVVVVVTVVEVVWVKGVGVKGVEVVMLKG
jgi:hypothetical protein